MGKSRQYRRSHLPFFKKRNRTAKLDRREGKNRHHLRNKCRGGDCSEENLLVMKIWKHDLWHRLFKNSDPEYIIAVLQRMMRMKHYLGQQADYSERSPDLPGEHRAA